MLEGKTNERITIRLASLPDFALTEYHPIQIGHYLKFTELTFKALSLGSVDSYIRELITTLDIDNIEIRIMRLPAYKSEIFGITNKGKIIEQQLYGRSWVKKPLIDIFPNCLYPNKTVVPAWNVGFRGLILNCSVCAVTHEVLHKSGFHNECEVRKLASAFFKEFRKWYIQKFDAEIEPLTKEWKAFERNNRTVKEH
jgi:hypothetical protein